jgi:predicted Kef-type K+ transport protein
MYTVGRIGILAVLTLVLWMAGLDFFSGLLFGLLLSVPAAYLLLRPSRERLTEALAARSVARRTAKADLRNRLSGSE